MWSKRLATSVSISLHSVTRIDSSLERWKRIWPIRRQKLDDLFHYPWRGVDFYCRLDTADTGISLSFGIVCRTFVHDLTRGENVAERGDVCFRRVNVKDSGGNASEFRRCLHAPLADIAICVPIKYWDR